MNNSNLVSGYNNRVEKWHFSQKNCHLDLGRALKLIFCMKIKNLRLKRANYLGTGPGTGRKSLRYYLKEYSSSSSVYKIAQHILKFKICFKNIHVTSSPKGFHISFWSFNKRKNNYSSESKFYTVPIPYRILIWYYKGINIISSGFSFDKLI